MKIANTTAAISYMNTPVPVGDAILSLCIGCTSIKVFLSADTYLYRSPGHPWYIGIPIQMTPICSMGLTHPSVQRPSSSMR